MSNWENFLKALKSLMWPIIAIAAFALAMMGIGAFGR